MSCKAPGLFQDSSSSIDLSDLGDRITEDDELDLDEAYDQLERMKQRVLQMKSMIVRPPATATDQVLEEFDKQANSENVHLKEVQLETSRAFLQIELVRNRLAETTQELVFLAADIQETERCTKELVKKLDQVPHWMEEHKQQAGLCLERYNELDITCCSYLTYSDHMRPLLVTLKHRLHSRITLACYQKQYNEILSRVMGTRMLLNKTNGKLMVYTQYLNNSLMLSKPKSVHILCDISNLIEMLEQEQEKVKAKTELILWQPSNTVLGAKRVY